MIHATHKNVNSNMRWYARILLVALTVAPLPIGFDALLYVEYNRYQIMQRNYLTNQPMSSVNA